MPNKLKNLALALIGFLIFSNNSIASGIPITGTGFGEQAGLLHFDYKTAERPSGTADDSRFDDPAFYIGPRKQFYIPPADDDFTGPGNPNFVANISIEAADCTAFDCLLKGFIWSDTIGWIALDGEMISNEIPNPADYPPQMYPRIKTTGALTGYAWNEYTGWIRLSDDDSGTTTPAGSQNLNDWGAWLDLSSEIIVDDRGTPDDITDDIVMGRPFHGYIWSEHIGWIKFKKEAGDIFDFDFGAFSSWFPDDTPPEILGADPVWFAVGVNTGYISGGEPRTVIWEDAVGDPDSGINLTLSKVFINRISTGCVEPLAQAVRLYPSFTNRRNATLYIPNIGNVQGVDTGFCKYRFDAKIVNNRGLATYIGNMCNVQDNATSCNALGECDWDGTSCDFITPPVAQNAISVYVRAGDYNANESDVTLPSDSAIADGEDSVTYDITLKDLAQNPILDVDCRTEYAGCPGREVTVKARLFNQLVYDLTQVIPNEPYPTPVKYNNIPLAANSADPEYLGDKEWEVEVDDFNLVYPLEITSYAPNSTYIPSTGLTLDYLFEVLEVNYEIIDDPLPPVSTEALETPGGTYIGLLDLLALDTTPEFIPPVFTGDPDLEAGEIEEVLSTGGSVDLNFNVYNQSSNSIAIDDGDPLTDNGGISIDNIFEYWSPDLDNPSPLFMETHEIKNITTDPIIDPDDNKVGWFDPFNMVTRYEMYDGEYYNGTDLNAINSVFRYKYPFYFDAGLLYRDIDPDYFNANESAYNLPPRDVGIRDDGTYVITGLAGIPEDYPYIGPDPPEEGDQANPYYYEPGEIDRSDPAFLGLSSTITKKIQFAPQQYLGDITDTKFRLVQEIAYRFANQPRFTIYAQSPLIDGWSVRGLGVEAIGKVAGEQLVTGRKFETVGTAATRKLQEQIRRNVAQLTSGLMPCPVAELSAFDTTDCVTDINGTMFAYYEGDLGKDLILGTGSDIVVPNNPYTIILKGGANLFIKDNIYYDPNNSDNASLGIIVIAEEIGKGANVYISPEPTNIVGVLYAEGSLLSRGDEGLYYGGEPGRVQDLNNQLYWQGSIASRNTIGGAAQEKIPEGIECAAEDTLLNCAQRYDLDYLRRFAVVIDTDIIPPKSFIANDGEFSGGGKCPGGTCTLGQLPTIVTLSGGNSGYILEEDLAGNQLSELAPFFIEQDPRILNNPPPGFTVTIGLESIQEIR